HIATCGARQTERWRRPSSSSQAAFSTPIESRRPRTANAASRSSSRVFRCRSNSRSTFPLEILSRRANSALRAPEVLSSRYNSTLTLASAGNLIQRYFLPRRVVASGTPLPCLIRSPSAIIRKSSAISVAVRFEFSLVLGHLLPSFQSELAEDRVERAACDLLRWVTRHHRRACAETNHSVLLALFEGTSPSPQKPSRFADRHNHIVPTKEYKWSMACELC